MKTPTKLGECAKIYITDKMTSAFSIDFRIIEGVGRFYRLMANFISRIPDDNDLFHR